MIKRYKCQFCKAKRLAKFMKKSSYNNYFRKKRFVWECADNFCGHALDKQSHLPDPLILEE